MEAADQLEFERAALLRDQLHELKAAQAGGTADARPKPIHQTRYKIKGRRKQGNPGR
jgi:excinuclease UvrABC nuclease subunit